MKVITWETLYYEDHGATLKHKCGKKDSSIAPFYLFSFLGLFFSLAFLLFWDNALLNDDHHTSIYLQLNDYNSILKQSMTIWMPPAVYRDMQWIKSDKYEKLWTVASPQILCQLHDHAKKYDNDECVMMN